MRNAFSVMARDDTLLGACFAISGDLGVDPLWMRMGFAMALFWSPMAAAGGYALALALAILARLIVPEPAAVIVEADAAETLDAAEELPLAA